MRVTCQRVEKAKCVVNNEVTGEIKHGLLIFVGFKQDETEDNLKKAKKNYFEGGNKNFAKRILKNLSENKGIEEASRILKEIEELEKNEEN